MLDLKNIYNNGVCVCVCACVCVIVRAPTGGERVPGCQGREGGSWVTGASRCPWATRASGESHLIKIEEYTHS